MHLKSIELNGFKSFAKKTPLTFTTSITAIVGPNGSGKSNVAESFRFVLGEQSMKSMRGKRGEDMIWNGSSTLPRAGRASVKLLFDNNDRVLNLDFDEVAIERVVNRDGTNIYLLNGSVVRLRDVSELLSQAHIGASGHHIISQGEADRILTASSRERREMLEDALGLTSYFYKREEAGRKLQKTKENMHEVELMRRELAPHLRFLQTQVKKVEEAERLRHELAEKYLEYLKREELYLQAAKAHLAHKRSQPEKELKELDTKIALLREAVSEKGAHTETSSKLIALEAETRDVSHKRQELVRTLGRIEGEEALHNRMRHEGSGSVPYGDVESFIQEVTREIEGSLTQESTLKERMTKLLGMARSFLERISSRGVSHTQEEELAQRKRVAEKELQTLEEREKALEQSVVDLRHSIEAQKDKSRDVERELFAAIAERSALEGKLVQLSSTGELLSQEQRSFEMELQEAVALIGARVRELESYRVQNAQGKTLSGEDVLGEERSLQQDRRRKIERSKIRLEEIGASNAGDILKEHTEAQERDQFLARELEDLELSAQKLLQLIDELSITLRTRFEEGIRKINKEFDTFFKLMFGGGTAALSAVEEKKVRRVSLEELGETPEEEEVEEGIEIAVSLQHKRIKGLHMLSGGERALTSIALIFAMSQVNPPPFLILDETDAALDEANSRRYGDMIENLSKKSQLILITHNRETMSRAGVLYGITMGSDSISKLLTVRFEEALAVAK